MFFKKFKIFYQLIFTQFFPLINKKLINWTHINRFRVGLHLRIANCSTHSSRDVRTQQPEIDLIEVELTVEICRQIVAHHPHILAIRIEFQVVDEAKENWIALNHRHIVEIVWLSRVPTADAFELDLRGKKNARWSHVSGWGLATTTARTDRLKQSGWSCAWCHRPRCLISQDWCAHWEFLGWD